MVKLYDSELKVMEVLWREGGRGGKACRLRLDGEWGGEL
jgi:hypothetical protein